MAHQPNIPLRTFPVAGLHRWLGGLALVFAGMLAGMEISLCVRSLSKLGTASRPQGFDGFNGNFESTVVDSTPVEVAIEAVGSTSAST